ncbi:MAG: hypothetical protein ABR592_05945 [Nitriliruptorales bacterium]
MNDEPRWIAEVAAELLRIGESMGARPGHMFGYPALYAGRRLAACAYGEGIAMKLPADRVQTLLATGQAGPFQPYGKAKMKEWVHVRVGTTEEVDELTGLIAESLAFVADAGT